MERWRSFFGSSGEDVWTIIDQAIILAATDYPQEFKAKRCDIAEMLFTRLPVRSATGENEATRLSASIVTNGTVPMDTLLDMDEVRDYENGNRHNRKKGADLPLPVDDGAESFLAGEVIDVRQILISADQSETVVLAALRRLESLQISVQVLKVTEIGKHVNHLRKHSSKRVRLLAKGLVRLWKELVDEWASNNQAVALNAIASRVSEDRRQPFPNSQEGVTPLNWREENLSPLFCHMGSVRGECSEHDVKPPRHDEDMEVPDVMGSSSRADHAGLVMVQNSGRQTCDGDLQVNKTSTRGSVCGRPLSENYKGVGGLEKSSNEGMKGKTLKIYTGKRPAHGDDVQLADKLEATKRKLHEGYSQAENAKKQRVAQFIDLPDLPAGAVPQPLQNGRWNASRR